MAKFVLKDPYLSIAGTDISDHVKQITVDNGVEEVAGEAMGDDTRYFLTGAMKIQSLSIELFQDFAASKSHALLNAALNTSTAIIIKPTSAATGATNPRWYGNMMCTSYNPLSGSIGDAAMAPAKFVPVDGTGMQWSASD